MAWNDPAIGIAWPAIDPVPLGEGPRAKRLAELGDRLPVYAAP